MENCLKVQYTGPLDPEYLRMSKGAAGIDLMACIGEKITIAPGQRALIPTGLRLKMPEGCEAQIRPRSGLALKYGITVLNAPGTIDWDYRGEIGVILINHGKEDFEVIDGMRIAQMVFAHVLKPEFQKVIVLEESKRGAGGFGSTGLL